MKTDYTFHLNLIYNDIKWKIDSECSWKLNILHSNRVSTGEIRAAVAWKSKVTENRISPRAHNGHLKIRGFGSITKSRVRWTCSGGPSVAKCGLRRASLNLKDGNREKRKRVASQFLKLRGFPTSDAGFGNGVSGLALFRGLAISRKSFVKLKSTRICIFYGGFVFRLWCV